MRRMANNDTARAHPRNKHRVADNNIRIPCEDHHREAMHEERDTYFEITSM